MSEEPAAPSPPEVPGVEIPAAAAPKRRRVWRWLRRLFAIPAAVVAALLVLLFTVDLGRFPQIKHWAEVGGKWWLDRPFHIGQLSARLGTGQFVLNDVVIEGRRPGDRPFLRAGRLQISVPLWSIASRNIRADVTLADWHITIEKFIDGSHNIPRLNGPPKKPSTEEKKEKYFTTTVGVMGQGGDFTYEDHATPWSVLGYHLKLDLVRAENLKQYVGDMEFTNGVVQIQNYEPMAAALKARFVLDGKVIRLNHVDLLTDGAVSHVDGVLELPNYQRYNINSTLNLPRMHDIFFAKETWTMAGQAAFSGVMEFPREGGRDLTGQFTSENASIDGVTFTDLHGDLNWTQDHFIVTHADANVAGGETRFSYSVGPFGSPGGATATFNADYSDFDLGQVSRFVDLNGLQLNGRGTGDLSLTWPNGRFKADKIGRGRTFVTPPTGAVLATRDLPAVPLAIVPEPTPFDGYRRTPLTFGADLHYRVNADGWTFEDGWAATPFTFIGFGGRIATTGTSELPFHVTSHDWQESDRLFAAIKTAIARSPSKAVEVGGRGVFDGVMTGTFSSPRIVGKVAAEAMRVWDVTWGRTEADIVVENGYVDIANARVGDKPDTFIVPSGRFALGYRDDDKEEIKARVQLTNWPMADLRHAFALDDWPMEGVLGSVTLDLSGMYRNMFGSGQLRIDRGVAWGEPFDTASADLTLEGSGMFINRINMRKDRGTVVGSFRVGWDHTYQFTATGTGLPVEKIEAVQSPRLPLSGTLKFSARGSGDFDTPSYEISPEIPDLFIGDEGIGPVSARLTVNNKTLAIDQFTAASDRLQIIGNGTVSLAQGSDANLHFRVTNTSLDPYLKFAFPADPSGDRTRRVTPDLKAIVSGALEVRGPLSRPEQLVVKASFDDTTLKLFEYGLKNNGPVQLTFEQNKFQVGQLLLEGPETNLDITGTVDLGQRRVNVAADGGASLSILQLFNLQVAASGTAKLQATLTGSLDAPVLTGFADITKGRVKPLASKQSIEEINGRVVFDAEGLKPEGLTARIGNGDVVITGSIPRERYRLTEYRLAITGKQMALRYPEGFSSTVDTRLRLEGPISAPRVVGDIDVLSARYSGSVESDSAMFGLAAGAVPDFGDPVPASGSESSIALDINVRSPTIAFVNTRTDRILGSIDLHVGGTYDRPLITGAIEIFGGEAFRFGNRFQVAQGSISFPNPLTMEPVFDVTATARPRVRDQAYNVEIHLQGTLKSFTKTITSDPWLPEVEVLSLLLGGVVDPRETEQRALGSQQQAETQFVQAALGQLIAGQVSSTVGGVFDRVLPGALDVVQITPVLTNNAALQNLQGGARITLARRISNRAYVTYSRTVTGAAQEDVLLLEYDESDRVSWVLSRNADRSFALDFRIRFVF